MSHSHRRKNSKVEYFRKDVPRDIQHLAGKTSWQHSLKTADAREAALQRARYTAHYESQVIRLRAMLAPNFEACAAAIVARAQSVVDQAFDRLAAHFGSMDRAVATELDSVALTVRSSWSREEALEAERDQLGEEATTVWEADGGSIDIVEDGSRPAFKLQAKLLETREETQGFTHQNLARELLKHDRRSLFGLPINYQVACMAYGHDDLDLNPDGDMFDALARAYLTRLTDHEFRSWPKGLSEAIGPVAVTPSNDRSTVKPSMTVPAPADQSRPITTAASASGRDLVAAFELWKKGKGIQPGERHKSADEFAGALRRFEALMGTTDVTSITPSMVTDFRNLVMQLPFRPDAKLKALPLREQIAEGHRLMRPTIMAPTVNKHIVAIKSVLAQAVEAHWITANPAAGVTVEGARWEGTERDYFSDEDMRLIYSSPLMTDLDACRDTIFWILFLAPFHGSRPGEHCKLKSHEVVLDGDAWQMRFRSDRRARSTDHDAPLTRPRRQKTAASVRDIPVHWIVEEGGFIDFAKIQRRRDVEWLFDDLVPDPYGDRYKYLSREINSALRELGISDADKAFYSTRHTMKREGRRRGVVKASLDQIAGHSGDTGDKYGARIPADVLRDDINRIEFRSVQWDPVVRSARLRVERMIDRYGVRP